MTKNKNKNWPTKKLVEVCELYDNGIWGAEDLKNGIRILRSTNFNNDGTINFDDIALRKVESANLKEKKLQEGDILLERSGGGPKQPVGRVVYFNKEGKYYFGNFLTRLRPAKEIYPKFLFHFLFNIHQRGITNRLQKQTTGIRNLKFKEYLEMEIPLPPLKIQKQIVARIEKLFEKIDKAKELRQKAQEETAVIFPSALQKIFIRAKKEKWRKIKLDQTLDLKDNGIWGPEDLQDGVPILRSTNFSNDGTINFDNVALRRIEIRNLNGKKLQKGDILLERSGGGENQPVGRVVYYDTSETYYFGNFLTRLRPKKEVYSKFLFNILFSFHQQGITNYLQKQTTGIRNLRFQEYLALEVPLPPLSEQKKIVAYLDNLREKIEKLKQLQESQLKDLEDLKKSILEKAFLGELVK